MSVGNIQERGWRRGDAAPIGTYALERDFPLRLKLLRWIGRQSWIPRGQDRLLRKIRPPEAPVRFLFEVDFFGFRYRGDLSHYIDWLVFCYGAAPLSELNVLADVTDRLRSLRSGPIVFLDIGANIGHHTLFMAGKADEVIAFEPFAPLQESIREKIELNNLANVRLVPFALGEKDDVHNYYPSATENSGTGTFLPDSREAQVDPVRLEVKEGDSLLAAMAVGRVDVLKVDVEGFEGRVFRGLRNRIKTDCPAVLMELTDESRSGIGTEQDFRDLFYPDATIVSVGGRQGRPYTLYPFDYRTADEVLILPPQLKDFAARAVG